MSVVLYLLVGFSAAVGFLLAWVFGQDEDEVDLEQTMTCIVLLLAWPLTIPFLLFGGIGLLLVYVKERLKKRMELK